MVPLKKKKKKKKKTHTEKKPSHMETYVAHSVHERGGGGVGVGGKGQVY